MFSSHYIAKDYNFILWSRFQIFWQLISYLSQTSLQRTRLLEARFNKLQIYNLFCQPYEKIFENCILISDLKISVAAWQPQACPNQRNS